MKRHLIGLILLFPTGGAFAQYQGSNQLKVHNHGITSGDGGQLSNLSVLGTLTVPSTTTIGSGVNTSTFNVPDSLNPSLSLSSGIALGGPVKFADGTFQFTKVTLTGNGPATISTENITSSLDVVGPMTEHSSGTFLAGLIVADSTITVGVISGGVAPYVDFTSAIVHAIAVDVTTQAFTGVTSPMIIPLTNNVQGIWDSGYIELVFQATGGTPAMMSFSFQGDTKEDFTATCNKVGAAQTINYLTSASSIALISVNCPAAGGGTRKAVISFGFNTTAGNQIAGFSDITYDTGGSVGGGGTHTNFSATNGSTTPAFIKFFWDGGGTYNFTVRVYHENK